MQFKNSPKYFGEFFKTKNQKIFPEVSFYLFVKVLDLEVVVTLEPEV